MQQVTRKTLGAGINLTCVTTPKFKRAVLRTMLVLPLGGEDAALRACLPQVLRRGTARLNDMQAFGTALDELYGARIEAAVRKEGENLCIGFLSDCIDETYAPGADGLTAGVIGLLCDLLYDPYLQDGLFCAAYVEGERGNLIDRIAALKNDPRSWAPRRLNELMCENENYGKSALGTIEQAERITPETLYAAYRRALSEAQVELFYCGTMMPDEVEAHFMATPLAQPREGTLYQPHTVVQAQAILDERKKILGEAKEEAKASMGKADAYYTEKVENAKRFEQDVKMEADAYDKQIRQKAQEDSNAIIADANTRAEQIVFNAQQQAQKLVEDNEITRRAQAYAVETRERAEKDADSIYNQACVQVDKMLSGAAAALSRSASELAALRDNLLTQGSAQQQDR